MLLNEIFAKDVQRPIEGVIKADDVAHLGTEVEEYVLTNEVAKGLELLLEEYTNYTNANGVWISGFFGSGKSHLLKMLAYLLGDVEGQEFDRAKVAESFRSKATGAFLPALLTKAEHILAKSLLFNIDQKATLITKDQTDALLKVFVKVFDESRGYYGNQGHVAWFERDLDNRGQYEAFKDAYARLAGIPWTQGREQSALEGTSIDRVFAEVNGGEATDGIIKQYQASYAVSIEDFADEVKAWLDKQPDGYRLNFYVDEAGQFIGSNTHLMLNLQTVAESLNTKCAGRAWVFVTSQEDMDKVVGDRTKKQGNDFTKIQARFKTRVKLTSADVEEVIRKRLLEKNGVGEAALEAIYSGSRRTSRRSSTSSTARRPIATTPTRPTSSGPTRSSATSSLSSKRRSRASLTTMCSRVVTAPSVSVRCSASSSRSPRTLATSRSARWRPLTTCSPASAPR